MTQYLEVWKVNVGGSKVNPKPFFYNLEICPIWSSTSRRWKRTGNVSETNQPVTSHKSPSTSPAKSLVTLLPLGVWAVRSVSEWTMRPFEKGDGQCVCHITWSPLTTHHFLLGAQHPQLAEAHVEGGALVGAVALLHHHHIDAAGQRGLVDALVQLLDRHQHLARQLAHVVHGVGLHRAQWGEGRRVKSQGEPQVEGHGAKVSQGSKHKDNEGTACCCFFCKTVSGSNWPLFACLNISFPQQQKQHIFWKIPLLHCL